MIGDWETWACASTLQRQHGEHAHDFIAERIAALECAGDDDGALTFRRIAERLAILADRTPHRAPRH